jgi:hypothetical protein
VCPCESEQVGGDLTREGRSELPSTDEGKFLAKKRRYEKKQKNLTG